MSETVNLKENPCGNRKDVFCQNKYCPWFSMCKPFGPESTGIRICEGTGSPGPAFPPEESRTADIPIERKRICVSKEDAVFLADLLAREIEDAAVDVVHCGNKIDYLVCCSDIYSRLKIAIDAYDGGKEWLIDV